MKQESQLQSYNDYSKLIRITSPTQYSDQQKSFRVSIKRKEKVRPFSTANQDKLSFFKTQSSGRPQEFSFKNTCSTDYQFNVLNRNDINENNQFNQNHENNQIKRNGRFNLSSESIMERIYLQNQIQNSNKGFQFDLLSNIPFSDHKYTNQNQIFSKIQNINQSPLCIQQIKRKYFKRINHNYNK